MTKKYKKRMSIEKNQKATTAEKNHQLKNLK
jgi:hypothetical protein